MEYPILTEADFRWVDYVMESEGIYCIYADGSYSFLAESGEEIMPITYPETSPFSEGLACVCSDRKYGYIDTNGDTALEFIYDYATPIICRRISWWQEVMTAVRQGLFPVMSAADPCGGTMPPFGMIRRRSPFTLLPCFMQELHLRISRRHRS